MVGLWRRFSRHKLGRWVVYFTAGYIAGLLLKNLFHSHGTCVKQISGLRRGQSSDGAWHSAIHPPQSNIYVGMMSAGKFVKSRVQRSLDTWLQKGGWKVEVFADADPSLLAVPLGLDVNIVTLPSVDDTAYPPQKKSFMMLRHMFDYHIDKFDWFMRVDDDVYIDYSRLSQLLSTINSSMPIFLGTPGFGMDPDDGMEDGMYYLMGGPGMIFSRGLLRELRSHLSHCIRHMFSPHEDIELGRCVWKYVRDAKIPKAWETIDFFYQQYDKATGDVINVIIDDLNPRRTRKTLAFHSVKREALLYQLHKLVLERKIEALMNETARRMREIDKIQAVLRIDEASSLSPKPSLSALPLLLGSDGELAKPEVFQRPSHKGWPETSPWLPSTPVLPRYTSQLVWENWDKYYRHQADVFVPVRGHSERERSALLRYLAEIDEKFIPVSCPNFPTESRFINGYMKPSPSEGFMLSLTRQTFDKDGMRYCSVFVQASYAVTMFHEKNATLLDLLRYKGVNSILEGDEALNFGWGMAPPTSPPQPHPRVVIVIPLEGRYRTLEHFMERYERDFLNTISKKDGLSDVDVQLVVVLLGGNMNPDELALRDASSNLLRSYQKSHGSDLVRYHLADSGSTEFSRGAGIQLGTLIANENDVMLFMDIDMIVTSSMVDQCRRIAVQGTDAWYPIPYSQYDPDRLCFNGGLARSANDGAILDAVNPDGGGRDLDEIREIIEGAPLLLSEERGFWRDFGMGIACMYKSDFVKAGGFDLSIEGWGEEDIRMYLSFVRSGLNIFRAKQVDLIHVYHPKHCDKSLKGEQAAACRRTKASHYASQKCLAKTYFEKTK